MVSFSFGILCAVIKCFYEGSIIKRFMDKSQLHDTNAKHMKLCPNYSIARCIYQGLVLGWSKMGQKNKETRGINAQSAP